jgi:parallel beta-helix repeat protein
MSSDNNKGLARSIQVNGLTWAKTLMICAILVCAGVAAYYGANVSVNVNLAERVTAVENRLDIPVNSTLSAFIKSNSFIVSELDQGFCLQNGSNGAYLPPFTSNSSAVIENGLGNASNNGGGSVYVSAGANLYNASVILLNNTRLVIETGAKNVTYSCAANAYAIVDDFQNWIFTYYSNGLPWSIFNYATGNLLTQSANMTSIYVQNIIGLSGNVQIFRFLIENGSSFPASPSDGYLFEKSNTVYYYNSTAWVPWGTGSGGTNDYNLLINKPDLSHYLFQNGTRALTANWSAGNYGIYGLLSVNATSLYCTTIDQLISGSGVEILDQVIQSGTSFPASPINEQEFYRSDQGYLYVYNNSAWSPIGYTPNTYPYANLTGVPQTFPYGNLTGVPNTYPYANLTGVPVLLLANGAQSLTADWNLGLFAIYNATWINATSISLSSQLWYNGNNCTDILANPWLPCSYILHTDGTYTWAKSGLTGQIAWYNKNATYVFNQALNASTLGEMVLATDGLYSLNGSILMQHNYEQLWGQSWNTILKADGYMDGPPVAMGCANSTNGPGLMVNGTVLANIQVDANNTGGANGGLIDKGVYCTPMIPSDVTNYSQYSWYNLVYHVYAHGAKSEGISFDFNIGSNCIDCRIEGDNLALGTWAEFAYYESQRGTIQYNKITGANGRCTNLGSDIGDTINNNIIMNSTDVGLDCRGAAANYPFKDCIISDNYIAGCKHGISLEGALAEASDNTIRGNIIIDPSYYGIYLSKATSANNTENRNIISENFVGNPGRHGIVLIGSNDSNVDGNTVSGVQNSGYNGIDLETYLGSGCFNNSVTNNKVLAPTTNRWTYGIREQNPGDYNVFKNNVLSGIATLGISINGTHDTVRGNIGFVTENSGYTASCVNGTWIAHGLAGQPNGQCELKVNGTRLINSTCYVMDPTIIAENNTYVQIEFLCNNAGTFAAVGTVEAKTILWYFEFKPP